MDFGLEDIAPELRPFREEVRAWLAEAMVGSEHFRWSASWSTRENEAEYAVPPLLSAQTGCQRLALSRPSARIRRRRPDDGPPHGHRGELDGMGSI